MLTPIDIHYIVGWLCQISNPDSVDVMLGDMVFDVAAGKERDIDVTITQKDENGETTAFLGIEVKDHKRPLTVEQVEQLCIKFKDIPSIHKGGIVSASGYTKGVITKAQYHKIDLYHIIEWNAGDENNDIIQFVDTFSFKERDHSWILGPNVTFNPTQLMIPNHQGLITRDSLVFDKNKQPIPNIKTCGELSDNMLRKLYNHVNTTLDKVGIGKEQYIDMVIHITDSPYVLVNSSCVIMNPVFYQLQSARIVGLAVGWEKKIKPDFRIMVKEGDPEFKMGYIIGEMSPGNLIGVVTSNKKRNLTVVNIPVSSRLKKKIYKEKLT